MAKSHHLKARLTNEFKILVPVSGSGVSRRGAEIAVSIARTGRVPMRLVYVSTTRDKGTLRTTASMYSLKENAILKDAAALATRYDVEVTTSIHANATPEAAILQEIPATAADIVVMGGDRIHGHRLSFGGVADAVLRKSDVSVMLVSNGASPTSAQIWARSEGS